MKVESIRKIIGLIRIHYQANKQIHFCFVNTSNPLFLIQANKQIQVIQIEIHHHFNCCFKQKGANNIRSMVSADEYLLSKGLLDQLS